MTSKCCLFCLSGCVICSAWLLMITICFWLMCALAPPLSEAHIFMVQVAVGHWQKLVAVGLSCVHASTGGGHLFSTNCSSGAVGLIS